MRSRRLTRLFDPRSSRTLIVPLDHGLAHGPMAGLRGIPSMISVLGEAQVDAVVLNPGIAALCHDVLADHPALGLIVHLSAGSGLARRRFRRSVVGSVESAIAQGADAVSVHLNVGADDDVPQLAELARTAEQCRATGTPLVAMMYTCGGSMRVEHLAHAARMADELGADIVKLPYPGSAAALAEIVGNVHCSVVCAGGSIGAGSDIVEIANGVVRAGGAGLAVGRQLFQSANPETLIKILQQVLHGGPIAVDPARNGPDGEPFAGPADTAAAS